MIKNGCCDGGLGYLILMKKRGRRDSGILSDLDKCIFLFISKDNLQSGIEILVESKQGVQDCRQG